MQPRIDIKTRNIEPMRHALKKMDNEYYKGREDEKGKNQRW